MREVDIMKNDNVQQMMYKVFYVFWAIFAVLFFFLFLFFQLNIKGHEVKQGYEMLTEYEAETNLDRVATIGIRQDYTFRLQGVEEAYSQLMFYTIHQNVRVFLNEVCIYRMVADEVGVSGKSPGCVWNQVSFAESDNGKSVRVEITPVYESSVDIVPEFYFGTKADIMQDVVSKGLPIIILSFIVIAIGIVYIVFILFHYKKSSVERNLIMLGYFAIQLGLWKLADAEAISLLFPGHPALSQLPFMALMLMCVSYTLFVREQYSTKHHFIWNIPCFVGFFNMGLTLLAQWTGIAEMRQMLPMTHFNIVLIAMVSCIMTVYEIRIVGWNRKLKRTTWCVVSCFLGTAVDAALYYATNGQNGNFFGMLGFVIYIIVLGFDSIQDIKNLMDIGIMAKEYEKMAYHDQLTGLFNRTAFASHISSEEFVLDKCIIVVMDLNNLKKCNDELGHDKGDIYIKECARMIQECFGELGHCYRMGGDEFYVLLENGNLHLCKQKVQELKERVERCNKVGNGFRMGIACGYQMYDKRMDYDISETARRADKTMYQEKFAMKEL